jgi:hypothetical protein
MSDQNEASHNTHIFEMALNCNPKAVITNNATLEGLGAHHLVSPDGHLTMLTNDGKTYDVLPDLTLLER